MAVDNQLVIFIAEILILIAEILLFSGLLYAINKIYNYLKRNSDRKIFNLKEYLPEEEIHTLKQVSYLIMITLSFINIIYVILFWYTDMVLFALFDCFVSLICCLVIDKSTFKHKIFFLLLFPLGSMTFLAFGWEGSPYLYVSAPFIIILFVIHMPLFLFIIKEYYTKFIHYTESNGLGVSILLLFTVVFVSLIFTAAVEHVDLIDSLVMVSNAFTSNGYTVLGTSTLGKLNSVLLVWGGYILSGVGTATLTAALLTRHFNKRFDELKELIDQNKED
ncbi:hypothetical protein TL18_06015 [Methanobrevibacter sp. YE315]|uniref:hypothetical protein n=1 Tax=Methanobrevibacter sp. YE315 TaxID=1609968 RepID=UPI000764E632|nr:hypothetical protein [Methanobrevibacter sp. YE315]AMD17611.1 hypothetical protein TL18_06015 [Methanobrevibacter sp. YE315]